MKNVLCLTLSESNFTSIFLMLIIAGLLSCTQSQQNNDSSGSKINGPYFATGIKIGEVTRNKATIWVRLTENRLRVGNDAPVPSVIYIDPDTGDTLDATGRPDKIPVVSFPEGYDINTIQGATPGSQGLVRLSYKIQQEDKWQQSGWQMVDPERSFTHQFKLTGLSEDTEYDILVEARPHGNDQISASMEGQFKTAAEATLPSEVNFIVTTGTSYGDVDSETGYKFYNSALKLDPEFFVHTGDILYYDKLGKTEALARWHWDRMYSYPNNIDFHRQVASYFIKDDHDTWMNDCYPGMETRFMGEFTYEQGTELFPEQVPMGNETYRTVRWGKDLQIWLMEGRDYRSPNPMPDGPEKTIWGEKQMKWFKATVESSDATFKVLISPTPIVGPDRKNKNDNHANAGFTNEGDQLRKFISEQKNMVVVCGDRHWQYISKDAETGVLEFSCGPGSDAHAGGWSQDNKLPEHIYLNVVGGFLEGAVSRVEGEAILTFRHYNPDGELLNEFRVEQ